MKTEPAKLSVKDWSPEDQPREKLLYKGVYSLSDAELLAIILGSGSRGESVVDLAQRILQSTNNNINQLGKLSVKQLMQFKGIGEAKAISIVAALELGKRRKAEEVLHRQRILFSKDVYEYFHPLLCDLYYEEFWVLFLNRASKVIDKLKISQGGIASTIVDAKVIYREALLRSATGIVLCHNHPSGHPEPSKEDDEVTVRVQRGLKFLDMYLQDHVIICDGKYYSYADEGRV
ncbi:MAG: DNA repair protein RadC [Dysgonamonadaceae bacterium]|jgi:DNA repair protein RadC|nr:DNA repair protein RadC [Dysgonamonadaceae bacterium]